MTSRTFFLMGMLLIVMAGCRPEAKVSADFEADDSSTASGSTVVKRGSTIGVSSLLRNEFKLAMAEQLHVNEPNTKFEDLKKHVEEVVERVVIQKRKDDPSFLSLQAEEEKSLKSGEPISDTKIRIEQCLEQKEQFRSGLIYFLLRDFRAGKLSAVRSELLAQMMAADLKSRTKSGENDPSKTALPD